MEDPKPIEFKCQCADMHCKMALLIKEYAGGAMLWIGNVDTEDTAILGEFCCHFHSPGFKPETVRELARVLERWGHEHSLGVYVQELTAEEVESRHTYEV